MEFFTQQGFVYGTSRNRKVLNSVFPLVALDVRDTASIQSAIAIISISGSLDIVINAGLELPD
jgi:NADP-dependent 3-hydroxy acid dehydrogenase YdfG